MSETRKLNIDGGVVKDDDHDHVSSYKPIPDTDAALRSSKSNLSKSKEKVSDGAEERLLSKEEEARIVRVDMADAKYVVGDHRNGDAKIELDANKRQFTGLTKEQLLKYADDPFWVNLRRFMFILFWAMWLSMLVGAVVIIVQTPKCPAPAPRTWYQKGPLVEYSDASYEEIEQDLPLLESSKVQGIFMTVPTYEVLDDPTLLEKFKEFAKKAWAKSIRVIVDLTPTYVSRSHRWFLQSENRSSEFADWFTWADGAEFDANGTQRHLPNNWVSFLNEPAWSLWPARGQYYLHQYGAEQPDLNFRNPRVQQAFEAVLQAWMTAGAAGVRLNKARELFVDAALANESIASGGLADPGAVYHTQRDFWQSRRTSDQPELLPLLAQWAQRVDNNCSSPGAGESVFTLAEVSGRAPLYQSSPLALRPPSAAPLAAADLLANDAKFADKKLAGWPAVQLTAPAADAELATFALLLPAAPVLQRAQLLADNQSSAAEQLSRLAGVRADASVQHGQSALRAAPARNSSAELLACVRWAPGHTGYVAVYNPTARQLAANLTDGALPPKLAVHHVSHAVAYLTGYAINNPVSVDDVQVPALSTVVLSFLPKTDDAK